MTLKDLMLSEISQSQKDKLIYLHEVSKAMIFAGPEYRMVGASGLGGVEMGIVVQ